MASTVTLQKFVQVAKSMGEIRPVLEVGGFEGEPATTAMNDAMNDFLANYPYKFNGFNLPEFYTNSWQQDYAIPGLTTLAWLTRGVCIDINSSAIPKPWSWVEVGRDQQKSTASILSNSFFASAIFRANWLPNNQLYYGTWGDANTGNATLGNNPVAGSVYTNPLGAPTMPANPISQIEDANGNFLVITTYGTEGGAAPLAEADSPAGTTASGSGASTVWTVVDPNGQGIRISPVPSQTGNVWQFLLTGQLIPPRFTSFSQKIDPVPDDYEPQLRALFIAHLYEYASESKISAKFPIKRDLAMKAVVTARSKSDRERDFYRFITNTSVKSGAGSTSGAYVGPFWPYGGPPR